MIQHTTNTHTNTQNAESYPALPHLCIHRDIGIMTRLDYKSMVRIRTAARGWLAGWERSVVK